MITLFIGESEVTLSTDCREQASKGLQVARRYLDTGKIRVHYAYLERALETTQPTNKVTVARLCAGHGIPKEGYKGIGFIGDFIYNALQAMHTGDFNPLSKMLDWHKTSIRRKAYAPHHMNRTRHLLSGPIKQYGEVDIPYEYLYNRALTSSLMVLPRCADTANRLCQEGARVKVSNRGYCAESSCFFNIMRGWILPWCNLYKYGNYGLACIVYLLSHWVDAVHPEFYNDSHYRKNKEPQPELATGIEHCLRLMKNYNGPNKGMTYLTRDYIQAIPEKLRADLTKFVRTDMSCLYVSRIYYEGV